MENAKQISTTEKTFRGLTSQSVVTLLRGVFELVFFSVMSRLLGKEEFGYFAILTVVLTLCKVIAEAGVGAAVIQNKEADKRYADTAFFFSLLAGGAIAAAGLLLAGPLAAFFGNAGVLEKPLAIVVCVVPLYGINSVLRALLMKQLKFLKYGLAQLASYTIASAVGILLALKGYGVYALVWLTVVDAVALCLILFAVTRYRPSVCNYSWRDTVGMFRYGGWLTLENLFRSLYQQLDSLLLSRLVPVATLGLFNRPRQFIHSVSTNINSIFDVTLFPILSDLQNEPDRLRAAFMKSVSLLNVFSGLLCVGFVFNARVIVFLFLGEKWMDLVPLFQILSIEFLLRADGRLTDCFFRSMALVRANFFFRVGACVLLSAAIVTGSRYGIYGMAAAVVGCNLLVIVVKMRYLVKKVAIPHKEVFARMMQAFLCPGAFGLVSAAYFILLGWGEKWVSVAYLLLFLVSVLALVLFRPQVFGKEFAQWVEPLLGSLKKWGRKG